MAAPPPRQPTRMFEAVPVFHVTDVKAAMDWFTSVLDFEISFSWPEADSGEPPTYAGVCRNKATIHLSKLHDDRVGKSQAMIFMRGIDEYAAGIKERGGTLETEPTNQPYRMRDFDVKDPDGNRTVFGMGIDADGNPEEE